MPLGFTQLAGAASQVAASPDGSAWVLGNSGPANGDQGIYHLVNGTFVNVPGAARRIAVGPDNTPWVLNAAGGIYRLVNGVFTGIAGGAGELSVGSDGSLYVISNAPPGPFGSGIYHYVSGTWTQLPGAGVTVAASIDSGTYPALTINPGGFYVTNATGGIFYYNPGAGFEQLPGGAISLAPTASGGLFALGDPGATQHGIYYNDFTTGQWTQQPGAAVSLSASATSVYAVGSGGGIYQSNVSPIAQVTSAPGTIPVASSSFVNDKLQNLGPQTLPPPGGNARAYADFFQDGTYGLFLHTLVYSVNDPTTWANRGSLHFYHFQSGAWVDQTSKILTDTVGCIHPRKAIVADFNGDGKPDIFDACHGVDAPPYSGEQPVLLLSQANGTYKKSFLPVTGYFHSASAAVLDASGFADIVVVDTTVAHTPYFLINNHDGTFHSDFSRLPAGVVNKQIFSVELMDPSNSGKFDLFLAGNEPNSLGSPDPDLGVEWAPAILKNNGLNYFTNTSTLQLPADPNYGIILDVFYQNGFLYALRTIDLPGSTFYDGVEVQKIAYPSMTASSIYTHSGVYPSGAAWIDWLYFYNGAIVSDNVNTPLSLNP